jgi:hypothetical protein
VNAYSHVEATQRAASSHSSTWREGLEDGINEMVRRYDPSTDGGVSFARSFGMLVYRLMVSLKNAEICDANGSENWPLR